MESVTAPVLAGTPTAGGSLVAGTTYYYTVIALSSRSDAYQYIGTNKNVMWSPISNQISFTADATNKSIALSWDKPTELSAFDDAQWGVFIYRSTSSTATPQKITTGGASRDPLVSTLTFTDDGTKTVANYYYPVLGVPRLLVPDGTAGSPVYLETIYTWLVANGWSAFIERSADEAYASKSQSWVLRFTIYNTGYLRFENYSNVTHNGTIWTSSTATLQMGEYNVDGAFKGVCYSYNFNSAYWYVEGTFIVYGSYLRFSNNAGAPAYYYGTNGKLICEATIWNEKFTGEMTSGTLGFIKNSIVHYCTGMFPSRKFFVDNVMVKKTAYAFYGYYGEAFMGMRGIKFEKTGTDIFFHKSTTVGVMHAVNIDIPNTTPTAGYSSNREKFSVLRKYEFLCKVIDESGDAISGATVELSDNTGIKYTITTNASGEVYLAKRTATSGSTTTLVDTSQNWTVNSLVDHIVDITAGTGLGQGAWILSNTSNTITFQGAIETAPASGSSYEIRLQPIKEKYYCVDSTSTYTLVSYNPFTLTISKAGYETYTSELTLTAKVDQTIALKTVTNTRVSVDGRVYTALSPEMGSGSILG